MRRVEADPAACIFAAFLLLVLPLRWLLAAAFAAAFHEGCHILAVRLCGGRIFRIHIGLSGAALDTDSMSFSREMLCALAGPLGSFLLLLLGRWFPEAAVCGLVQGAYNLLPVYPLDGGRALRCFLGLALPGKNGERLASSLGKIVSGIVLGTIVFLLFRLRAWFFLIFLALSLLFRGVLRKIACKPSSQAVQ